MIHPLLDRLEKSLRRQAEEFPGVAGFSVRDLVTDEQIGLLGDEPFPSASTIKIWVLITLLSQAEQSPDLLRERIPVNTRIPGSGVLTYLEDPVELSLLDLAILMMIASDNTATNICIERAGMQAVNRTIADFGLERTTLRRVMQDREAILAGRENLTSPNDLVATFAALHAGKPSAGVARRALEIMSRLYASPFRSALPSTIGLAHKTGGMPRVRSEAGLIDLPNRPYAIAVMCTYAMNDTVEQDRFLSDMLRTTHQVFATLADANPYGQGMSGS